MAQRRSSVSKVMQAALGFLTYRDNEKEAQQHKKDPQKEIKEYLLPDEEHEEINPNKVRVDEKGHRYLDFEKPVTINGRKYGSIKLERKVTGPFASVDEFHRFFGVGIEHDDEALAAWADLGTEEHNRRAQLRAEVYKEVTRYEWDFDAVYRLLQQDKMTKEEVESLFETFVGWSMVPKETR